MREQTYKMDDLKQLPRDPLDPAVPTGLILGGMGGPDGPESVKPFLRNLFRDPAVLPLPALFARLLGYVIVQRRYKKVCRRYAEIGHGGGSPQLDWANRQCEELGRLMNDQSLKVISAPAMRYWHPFPTETVEMLLGRSAAQFLVMPAYPQFASATSGSILFAICDAVKRSAPGLPVRVITHWHLLKGYITALVNRAVPVLRRWAEENNDPERCALLCVAHSLPERFLKSGDPYLSQTRETVMAFHEHLIGKLESLDDWRQRVPGVGRPLLAFQSKVGPVRWIGPAVLDEVRRLAAAGCRRLLLMPLSFTCEHIETLHELDIELAAEAGSAGIEEFVRGEALNLDKDWLSSMAELLRGAVLKETGFHNVDLTEEQAHA
ncbi:MAG: ferrochelatase [Planctomycetota bacterium]